MDSEEACRIIDLLFDHYGLKDDDDDVGFDREPFRALISVILSQQTTAHNSQMAAERLFSKYDNVHDLANAELSDVEDLVHCSGYYRQKAKAVVDVSKALIERFDGTVPSSMEDLTSLPHVGTKTAACVRTYSFNEPSMIVDTHIHRLSNRIGFTDSKNANQTCDQLIALIPKDHWTRLDKALLAHGHLTCTAKNPRCDECIISDSCRYFSSDRCTRSCTSARR